MAYLPLPIQFYDVRAKAVIPIKQTKQYVLPIFIY